MMSFMYTSVMFALFSQQVSSVLVFASTLLRVRMAIMNASNVAKQRFIIRNSLMM